MKALHLMIAVIVLLTAAINAQVKAKEPTAIVSEFFGLVKANRISAAYKILFAGSSLPQNKPQAVAIMKRQTSTALSLYGSIIGIELVKTQKYGNSLIKLIYLLKFNHNPTVWCFYFYKAKKRWFVTNVAFNDRYNLLD